MVLPLKSAEMQGLAVIEFKPSQNGAFDSRDAIHTSRPVHAYNNQRKSRSIGKSQPQFQRGKNITQINSSTAVFLANILKHMCLLQIADSRFRLNQSHF